MIYEQDFDEVAVVIFWIKLVDEVGAFAGLWREIAGFDLFFDFAFAEFLEIIFKKFAQGFEVGVAEDFFFCCENVFVDGFYSFETFVETDGWFEGDGVAD